MSSLVWLTRAFALCALLPRTSAIQEVGKNDSILSSSLHSDCYFYGEEGKENNLTPLDGRDDKPRSVCGLQIGQVIKTLVEVAV